MHDVHRDSLIHKRKTNKLHGNSESEHHDHDKHSDHGKHDHKAHSHEPEHGHNHKHDDSSYEKHDSDLHIHKHDHQEHHEDRAWNHMHEHAHLFHHQHHHLHDPEHTSLVHKLFKDPVRDWFAAALMILLILAGHLKWLPGHLSDAMLVCAAMIGIFPVFKNALFLCIAKRKPSFELLLASLLIAGLLSGSFLETALVCLFLLMGSFMKLDFSWGRN